MSETPAVAISKFEKRMSGMKTEEGSSVTVSNVRVQGDIYMADIAKTWSHEKRSDEFARDVQYSRDYIDLLVRIPAYNNYEIPEK